MSIHTRPAPVLYFGVYSRDIKGHCLWGPEGFTRKMAVLPPKFLPVDSRWCVAQHSALGYQPEGMARIHFVDGHTIIAWWDRSGDTRPGSNSAFVLQGHHPWEKALELATAAFPRVIARMTARFAITLIGPDLASPPDSEVPE